jgi:acetyltransferase-like isoleucine patch superfamily enzyme
VKTHLKKLLEKIDKSHPFIGALVRRIYFRKGLNSVRRVIHGKNNRINCTTAILSSVVFNVNGDGNAIEINDGCVLNNVTFHIRGNNHRVLIGRSCIFSSGGVIVMEDSDCSLIIGEKSTFDYVQLAITEPGSRLTIGRDCMFAYDIDVRTGDSHSIISQSSNERINYAKDIFIGDHVWVAAHSILLKGSSISENSVVATGSVVTKAFEKKGIVIGGNPSTQIKEGITWSRKRIYKTGQPGSTEKISHDQ